MIGRILLKEYQKVYRKLEQKRGSNFIYRNLEKLAKREVPRIERSPMLISDFEWDNLIILDGCRLDTYRKVVDEGVDSRVAFGGHSQEFIQGNFSDDNGQYEDVVLITANPHYENELPKGVGFKELTDKKAENVFHEVYRTYNTHWDEENSTVMPEDILSLLKVLKSLYPEKRFLIHLMQPHFPFIDSDLGAGKLFDDNYSAPDSYIWKEAEKGAYSDAEIREAYTENLEYAMDEVEEMVDELDGKSVITADHGNFLGTYGLYGHAMRFGENMPAKYGPLRVVPFDIRGREDKGGD